MGGRGCRADLAYEALPDEIGAQPSAEGETPIAKLGVRQITLAAVFNLRNAVYAFVACSSDNRCPKDRSYDSDERKILDRP